VTSHSLYARIHKRRFRQVVVGHTSRARLAVTATISEAIDLLEAHGIGVSLRRGDEVRAPRVSTLTAQRTRRALVIALVSLDFIGWCPFVNSLLRR